MRFLLTSLALALSVTSAFAETPAKPGGPLTCSLPVAPKESAKAIKARFGKNAVIKTLPGAEGQDYKALVLYPKDKAHELIVTFSDDAMTNVSSISLGEAATGWTIAGMTMGGSLADVQKANGKVFDVSGFNWDYGGNVTSWHDGALDKPMEGGCVVAVRFISEDPDLPASMSGDGVTIKSSNARLAKAKLKISELSINFP